MEQVWTGLVSARVVLRQATLRCSVGEQALVIARAAAKVAIVHDVRALRSLAHTGATNGAASFGGGCALLTLRQSVPES